MDIRRSSRQASRNSTPTKAHAATSDDEDDSNNTPLPVDIPTAIRNLMQSLHVADKQVRFKWQQLIRCVRRASADCEARRRVQDGQDATNPFRPFAI